MGTVLVLLLALRKGGEPWPGVFVWVPLRCTSKTITPQVPDVGGNVSSPDRQTSNPKTSQIQLKRRDENCFQIEKEKRESYRVKLEELLVCLLLMHPGSWGAVASGMGRSLEESLAYWITHTVQMGKIKQHTLV